jgi:dTDP-4-amino-4,6-dideoxygalactose transaminase
LGDRGCFSFHPRKSITTGEGGMVTTNDDLLADKINILRNHGASISEEQRHHGPKPYILPDFDNLGFNYRMTDLQGALGVVQLEKLDSFINEREKWAKYYIEKLKDVDWLKTPTFDKKYKHGWQSFVTFIDEKKSPHKRNEIMDLLQQKGISTRPGTHAIHMLGYYSKTFKIKKEDFYNSFLANDFSMSIPLHNKMVSEDYEYIVDAIKSI